jgi:hypothetical protein
MKSCTLEFEDKVVAGGEQVTTTVEARGVCQLTRLVVPDDVAPHFEVLQLKVRDVGQINYRHSTPARAIPAAVFGESVEGNFLKLDTAHPGDLVTLVVRNTSESARLFRARIMGCTSEEDGSSERPRPWWALEDSSDLVWTEDTDASSSEHEGVDAAYRRICGTDAPKAVAKWAPNVFGRCELLPDDVVVWYSHTARSEIRKLKPALSAAVGALVAEHELAMTIAKLMVRRTVLAEVDVVRTADRINLASWLSGQLKGCDDELFRVATKMVEGG